MSESKTTPKNYCKVWNQKKKKLCLSIAFKSLSSNHPRQNLGDSRRSKFAAKLESLKKPEFIRALQLLPPPLLQQVNHSPVSSMFCSAELCCYSASREAPVCPCCQIRPEIWPRARFPASDEQPGGKTRPCFNQSSHHCTTASVYILKRCLPTRIGELWKT